MKRRLRYQWFGEVIRDLNADVLLTAHHLDDQLETILYRVLSGRSTRSSLECLISRTMKITLCVVLC